MTVIRPELVGPALLAVALCGFWLYLGALAVIGVAPRTAITGGYYAVLGALMWAWVVLRRRRLMQNLLGSRWPRIATASAVILFMWFEVAALTSATTLSHRFAALVLLSSVPAAFVAASLDEEELLCAVRLVVALGGVFALVEVASIGRGSVGGRFSPIPYLDPISAAQIPALGAVALLALGAPRIGRSWTTLSLLAVLTLGVLLPGSRGPLLAVSVAAIVILSRRTRRVALITVTVMVLSGTAGYSLASRLGSAGHLTADLSHSGPWSGETVAASSAEERVWLIRHAIRAGARHLFAGNGVGNLSDYSRTSLKLQTAGCCTYPHDPLVEAFYSFGLAGLALFVLVLAVAIAGGMRVAIKPASPAMTFIIGLLAYAVVEYGVSGELGVDVPFWVSVLLVLAWWSRSPARCPP